MTWTIGQLLNLLKAETLNARREHLADVSDRLDRRARQVFDKRTQALSDRLCDAEYALCQTLPSPLSLPHWLWTPLLWLAGILASRYATLDERI